MEANTERIATCLHLSQKLSIDPALMSDTNPGGGHLL